MVSAPAATTGTSRLADGKAAFVDLIHYAYDQGITFIDTAQAYATFNVMADAIKGLPREKLFIQSKVDGRPEDVLAVIDHHRKTFDTDYVDSLIVHCMTRGQWTDEWKRVMDAFDQAKDKKWIRAKGVTCHTLPALRAAVASDWTEVHQVRVNPQGAYTDRERDGWRARRRHRSGDGANQGHGREGARHHRHENLRQRHVHRPGRPREIHPLCHEPEGN